MTKLLNKLAGTAVDLVFPIYCLGCRAEGRLLCDPCLAKLPRLAPPYCPLCAQPGAGQPCRRCAALPLEIDGIRAPFLMEGLIREAVHRLKYHGVRAAAPPLGRILARYLESHRLPAEVIVPVPLHPSRLRSRGYNQAALLARELGKHTGLPVAEGLLARTKHAPPQIRAASLRERRSNVAGAFACVGDPQGKTVLLVDDVVTTGSTMAACAAALKAGGAASVWGLAVAKEP